MCESVKLSKIETLSWYNGVFDIAAKNGEISYLTRDTVINNGDTLREFLELVKQIPVKLIRFSYMLIDESLSNEVPKYSEYIEIDAEHFAVWYMRSHGALESWSIVCNCPTTPLAVDKKTIQKWIDRNYDVLKDGSVYGNYTKIERYVVTIGNVDCMTNIVYNDMTIARHKVDLLGGEYKAWKLSIEYRPDNNFDIDGEVYIISNTDDLSEQFTYQYTRDRALVEQSIRGDGYKIYPAQITPIA